MARRRVTVRRIDPWSVLKFSFLLHLVGLLILLLASVVAWYFIRRLELVETVCELASQVSIQNCGVDAVALFRAVATLGALGVVVLTGIAVFSSFLANLILDLTGGVELTLLDDTPARQPGTRSRSGGATGATAATGAATRATGVGSRNASPDDGSDDAATSSTSVSSGNDDASGSGTPGGGSRGSGGSDDGDATVTRSQGPPLFDGGDGTDDRDGDREGDRLFGGGRTD